MHTNGWDAAVWVDGSEPVLLLHVGADVNSLHVILEPQFLHGHTGLQAIWRLTAQAHQSLRYLMTLVKDARAWCGVAEAAILSLRAVVLQHTTIFHMGTAMTGAGWYLLLWEGLQGVQGVWGHGCCCSGCKASSPQRLSKRCRRNLLQKIDSLSGGTKALLLNIPAGTCSSVHGWSP